MAGETKAAAYRSQLLLRQFLSKLTVKRNMDIKLDDTQIPADVSGKPYAELLQLLDLPEELIIRILSYIPFNVLISYRCISHAFNTLITHSKRLQYSIALEIHRLIHNPHSSLPLSDRLRLLEAREEAWRLLKPNLIQKVEVPHHASWVHDLDDGIFLLGDSVTRQKVIASNTSSIWGTKAVSCFILQSLGYSSIGHTNTWKSFDPGRDILNAGMAIDEHDLIALVTTRPENPSVDTHLVIEIQLLQFSTGRKHPSATLPFLLVARSKQESGRPEVSLEILGRHLAILVAYGTSLLDEFDQFVLFDWKKGTIIMSSPLPFRTYHSLTFLTPHILLIPNISEGSLDIFHISSVPSTPNQEPQPFVRACALLLPPLRSSFYYRLIACRADPKNISIPESYGDYEDENIDPDQEPECKPVPVPRPDSAEPIHLPHTTRPFRPSPTDSIALFHIGVQNTDDNTWGTGGMRVYSLITHRHSLLALIPPPQTPTQPSSSPNSRIWTRTRASRMPTVPWNDWGPRYSRLLDSHDVPTRLITASSGERYVRLAPDRRIHLLDFNPHHVRLETARALAGTSESTGTGAGADPGANITASAAADVGTPPADDETDENETTSILSRGRGEGGSVQVVPGRMAVEHGSDSNPWRKKLYTNLPYVRTISEESYPIGAALIDEERIIGLKLNHSDNVTAIRVLHFG